jgi:hypothetical protein
MPVIRIGLDVAKNVFQVHGVDQYEMSLYASGCAGRIC